MSGFVTIVNGDGAPVDGDLLERMTQSLVFRGPDAQCARVVNNVGLGHTFLDLSDRSDPPNQPFTLDGTQWIVADARVDARVDLVTELRACGQHGMPSEASDVELILRSYRAWGDDCLRHLLGDFAFALWDQPHRRLFCARDHLGIKPFFYAERGSTVVVSNTLDCVRLHPLVSRDLYEPAIADFLLFGANHEPDTTSFRDIRRLAPAHCMTWTSETSTRRRYWTPPIDEPLHFTRADEYTDRFLELLRASLRDRLRTRRVTVFMSGGVDSTTLAAVAQSVLREQSTSFSLQAVTSVYDRLIPDRERHYAGLVADHLRIPIRFDVRDEEVSIAQWNQVSVHTPEPVDNPPACAASVAFLTKMAADARVFLYGEGPDNALRYEWRCYIAHLLSRRDIGRLAAALSSDLWMHRRVPFWSSIRRLAASGLPTVESFPPWLNEGFAARCACRERWHDRQRSASSPHSVRPLGHSGFGDARWQSLFEDCDLSAALSHADIRHPFLDLRLLRYMLAVPAMPWCRNKLLVRRAMRTALPPQVLWRRKNGVAASADFERVKAAGFPRLAPVPDLMTFVNAAKVPAEPRTAIEMRAALRPLGLNTWLRDMNRR